MLPTILGGANFVLHSAGWLEGGLAMGYEKFMMDVDQCGARHAFAKGVDLSPNGHALDGCDERARAALPRHAHTLRTSRPRSTTPTADNNSFEQWTRSGEDATARHASGEELAEYEPPPLDEATDEELRDFIDRTKASFPDSNA